jgi:hypothetical protein
MHNRIRLATFVICIVGSRITTAQMWDRMTTPQIPVLIQHAPVVKVSIEHVAFTKPEGGACADAFTDALVADFTSSGATVVDRSHWDAVVAQHKLNVNSAHIDAKTAAKIGKLIGAGTLIFVKVHDCAVKRAEIAQDYKDKEGNIHRVIRTKLNGALRASVQATNLTTGITLGARMINITVTLPRDTDTSASFGSRLLSATTSALISGVGTEQLPDDDVVVTNMQNDGVAQIHRLFFPWTETRKLHIYDEKECGLNTTFRLLRGGDNEGAALEAQTSLETCKSKAASKPSILAHAYYNVGMTQFILENHDAALEALGQAVRLDGGTIITDAMSVCRRAKALAKEMQELEAQTAPLEKIAQATAQPVNGKGSPEERLQKLTDLHKKGILTDEEYKAKRAEILKDM